MQKSNSDRLGSRIEEFTSGSVGSAKGASHAEKERQAGRGKTRQTRPDETKRERDRNKTGWPEDQMPQGI